MVWLFGFSGLGNALAQADFKSPPIEKSGQVVMVCLEENLGIQGHFGGDILNKAQEVGDSAGFIPLGFRLGLHVDDTAIAAEQPEYLLKFTLFLCRLDPFAEDRRAIFRMKRLGPTVSQALLQAEPIELLPTSIGVVTTPGCIRGVEANGHVRSDLFGFLAILRFHAHSPAPLQ